MGQRRYAEAEPLLLSGYQGLKLREPRMMYRTRKEFIKAAIEPLVQLYEIQGQTGPAAEWKKKLKEFEQTHPGGCAASNAASKP